MTTVTVNGAVHRAAAETTVADLVQALGADPQGCAVAVNEEVLPRSGWPARLVRDGDRVEVLTAVQGG